MSCCEKLENFLGSIRFIFDFTFPDDQDFPSRPSQYLLVRSIALPVFSDLVSPILPIDLWNPTPTSAVMPMPETSMHKNNFSFSRKDKVRCARQIISVQSVAISSMPDNTPDLEFNAAILTFHPAHDLAPFSRRKYVGHAIRLLCANSGQFRTVR